MRNEIKRKHLTAILKLAGCDYQDEDESRSLLMPMVMFIDEQEGGDDECSEAHVQTGFRVLVDEAPCHKPHTHLSKFLHAVTDDLMFEGDTYLSDCSERVQHIVKTQTLEDEFSTPWFTQRDSQLTYSILDYRPLVFQSFVSGLLEIKSPQTAIDASEYRFNKLEWTNTNAGLLKKCVDSRVDLKQF